MVCVLYVVTLWRVSRCVRFVPKVCFWYVWRSERMPCINAEILVHTRKSLYTHILLDVLLFVGHSLLLHIFLKSILLRPASGRKLAEAEEAAAMFAGACYGVVPAD